MSEPIASFQVGEVVKQISDGKEVMVLLVNTYCTGCDRFLDSPKYSVKAVDNSFVKHGVKEIELDYNY
ncbi:hypothetical protein vBAmePPT11V19_00076 [Alteromonas phage vB_AmeP_PT11-V19]|nr:hypothetical protein vBAmePPT11V19_00076 [Alteromonas phage vB_AmeP_PT11-V19]